MNESIFSTDIQNGYQGQLRIDLRRDPIVDAVRYVCGLKKHLK
jgi:hypothetical protein